MAYDKIKPVAAGEKITIADGKLQVPDQPVIPFIEGDGTGPDIWKASVRVLDAASRQSISSAQKEAIVLARGLCR
jgi:isocitrate dehydrogenase